EALQRGREHRSPRAPERRGEGLVGRLLLRGRRWRRRRGRRARAASPLELLAGLQDVEEDARQGAENALDAGPLGGVALDDGGRAPEQRPAKEERRRVRVDPVPYGSEHGWCFSFSASRGGFPRRRRRA